VPPLNGDVSRPGWLKGRAARLWDEKVAIYRQRGQSVLGCESALAQYCALEALLIEQHAKKLTPPTSQLTAFRAFASEFFDTPASQIASVKSGKPGAFAANRRPPQPTEGASGA
jgi:hypothetical protein